ncbi:hypothetical protein T484DRAFT_1818624, partial [Baffinella frigidus]
ADAGTLAPTLAFAARPAPPEADVGTLALTLAFAARPRARVESGQPWSFASDVFALGRTFAAMWRHRTAYIPNSEARHPLAGTNGSAGVDPGNDYPHGARHAPEAGWGAGGGAGRSSGNVTVDQIIAGCTAIDASSRPPLSEVSRLLAAAAATIEADNLAGTTDPFFPFEHSEPLTIKSLTTNGSNYEMAPTKGASGNLYPSDASKNLYSEKNAHNLYGSETRNLYGSENGGGNAGKLRNMSSPPPLEPHAALASPRLASPRASPYKTGPPPNYLGPAAGLYPPRDPAYGKGPPREYVSDQPPSYTQSDWPASPRGEGGWNDDSWEESPWIRGTPAP